MPRRSRPPRRLWSAVAWAMASVGIITLALFLVPDLQRFHRWLAMAAAFIPYGVLAWASASLLILLTANGHRKALALLTGAALAVHSLALRPYLPHPVEGSRDLTIVTVNLRFGKADLDELTRQVTRSKPDVVVLTEVVAQNLKTLTKAPWSAALPFRVGRPGSDFDPRDGSDASGTMVWARHRLDVVDATEGTHFDNLAVRVSHPEGDLVVIAAHPVNPVSSVDGWLDDAAALEALIRRHLDEPLVVAGDLNATMDHVTTRELLDLGFVEASADAGAGWLPTYPSDSWFPPLIMIDHVLVNEEFAGVTVSTFPVAGSDHRGLVADLRRR